MSRTLFFRRLAQCRRMAVGLVAMVAGLMAVCPSPASAQDTIRLGEGTAQIFFSSTKTRSYNFGITDSGAANQLTLGFIDVQLKGQGNARENLSDATIHLYGGLGGTGSLLAMGVIPVADLDTQFALRRVTLSNTLQLAPGGYSIVLTTTNVKDYYIKDGPLVLSSTSGATLSNLLWVQDNTGDGTAGATLTASGTVLAQPVIGGTSVNFGNFRLGGTLSQTISLGNSALPTSNNRTQALVASGSAVNGASVVGLTTPSLYAGQSTDLTVGLSSGSAGPRSGSVSIAYSSVSGTTATSGSTAIGTGAVAVSGTGWRPATLSVSGTTVNLGKFHVGASNLSGSATVANAATADGYSERLAVAAGGSSGGASVASLPASIAAGGSGAVGVGLASVSSVGANGGTVTLDFASSGQGTSSLADLALGSRVIDVVAEGYSGQAVWSIDADGEWNTFASWDTPGGKPGVDGALSTNDTAMFGGAASANRTVRLDGASPVLTALTFSNSTARYSIAAGSGGELTLGTPSHAATVTNQAGTHSIAAGITLVRATAIDAAAGSALEFAGSLSGTSSLTKTGAGELAITGTGSLSGGTRVSAGALRVNGSLASSSIVIDSGATLTGSGVIGDTIVSGTHSPGNSPGVQTVTGDLTYQGGSTVLWELVDNTVSGRGTNYDGIDVTGGLTFAGTTALDLSFTYDGSDVDWSNAFWATSHTGTSGWLVYDGATSLTGFSNLLIGGTDWADAQGDLLHTVRSGAAFSTYQHGNDIYLTYTVAVPEPAAWVLLATGAALMWPLARRRMVIRP